MNLLNKKYPKYILLVAVILLLGLSLAKLFAASESWSNNLIVIEVTCWITTLCIVFILHSYYTEYQNINTSLKKEIQTQRTNFEKIGKEQQTRIEELEELVNIHNKFYHHREEALGSIFSLLKTNNKKSLIDSIIPAIATQIEAVSGIVYWLDSQTNHFVPNALYALDKSLTINNFTIGDGFCGQAVLDKKIIIVDDIPEDYVHTSSGLGSSLPTIVYYLPIEINGVTLGLVEVGSFRRMDFERIWPDVNHKIQEIFNTFN